MVEVARAFAEDVLAIAAMEQEPGTKEFILPSSLEEHSEKMTDPDIVYLRITHEDALVGFFILALDSDESSVEFRRIVVTTKGKGFGQGAVTQMEHYCRTELRRSRVWLDVYEHNTRARHIYQKLGYRTFGHTAHEETHLLLYEKQL